MFAIFRLCSLKNDRPTSCEKFTDNGYFRSIDNMKIKMINQELTRTNLSNAESPRLTEYGYSRIVCEIKNCGTFAGVSSASLFTVLQNGPWTPPYSLFKTIS